MSFEKLFECLHNEERHMGDVTENQAMNVTIALSQRHATPHHKPKTSWKGTGLHQKDSGSKKLEPLQ